MLDFSLDGKAEGLSRKAVMEEAAFPTASPNLSTISSSTPIKVTTFREI